MSSFLLRGAASNPRLAAALMLEASGLSVLPWAYKNGEKCPTRYWAVGEFDPMTSNDVRQWWMSHPTDNIGVITGETLGSGKRRPTDIVGIDLDTKEALAWAAANLATTSWRTKTGREGGGEHWVYRLPELADGQYIKTCRNHAGINGLDVRGRGGYISVPPSMHKSGNLYQWISRPADIAELPLLDLSLFPPSKYEAPTEENSVDAADFAVQAAIQWLETQSPAIQGQGGGDHSFSIAATLRRGFLLSLDQAREVIAPWNDTCLPPWEEKDMDRLLVRAWIHGNEEPGVRLSTIAVGEALRSMHKKPAAVASAAPAQSLQDIYGDGDDLDEEDSPEPRRATVSLATARDVALSLPADALLDTGAPFTLDALAASATLKREDLPGFIRLRAELKNLGKIPMSAWDQAVRKAGSPLRARETEAASKLNEGDRKRVVMTGDDKALVDDILAVLAESPSIFVSNKKLCHLSGTDLTPLSGDLLHNVVLQLLTVVKGTADKTTGDVVMLPVPIPRQTIGLLSNLLPEQRAQFRQLDQVLHFPFVSLDSDNKPYLVDKPGYDATSHTYLVSVGGVSLDRFSSAKEASEYIQWLVKDFPFMSDSERDNYIGMLMQLILRPIIAGPTPLYIIEGNQSNIGKTLLAKLPIILSGRVPAKLITWPDKGAEEATKALPEILRRGEAVAAWDNAVGSLASSTFESLLTSQIVELRIMGTSRTEEFIIKQLFLLTSNNAETNKDMSRRVVRSRLVQTIKRPPEIVDFEAYCANNRGEILSALLRLAKAWIDKGAVMYTDLPVLDSYPVWGTVIGSVLRANGFHQWMQNRDEAKLALQGGDEWVSFTQAWWDKYKGEMVNSNQLLVMLESTGLLGNTIGDGNPKSQQTKLGTALRKQNQAVHSDGTQALQIQLVSQRANASGYRLKNLTLTVADEASTLQKAG